MRITIYDMDFYHKFSFAQNIKCMKIASFHAQNNDIVNFVTEDMHLRMDYDIMYVVRENKLTPFPPTILIDDNRVKLIGREFKVYPNYYEIDMVMSMCRPDYELYDLDDTNKLKHAHMIQLLHGKTKLPIKQDYIRAVTKGRKKFMVTDEHLWRASTETIIECLEELNELKSLAFLYPISLKRVLSDERIKKLFSTLNFAAGVRQKFKNDYGSTFAEVREIVDLMHELKKSNHRINIQAFPVKSVIYDHWKYPEKGIEDIKRCLQIMDYASQREVKVILKASQKRLITPYWVFFDIFEVWSTHLRYFSYIEAMLHSTVYRYKRHDKSVEWYDILNNPIRWATPRSDFMLHILLKYPEVILHHGLVRWGDETIDLNLIDLDAIKQYTYVYEREEIMQKVEEELKNEIIIR